MFGGEDFDVDHRKNEDHRSTRMRLRIYRGRVVGCMAQSIAGCTT